MLESNNDILLTFQKSQFRVFDIKSKLSQIIFIDQLKERDENLGFVLAGAVSHCNNFISVTDDLKNLYLYNKENFEWKLFKKCSLERRCSSIKFSYDNQSIIVADKSGYILRIPIDFEIIESSNNKDEEKLRWVSMGHVSVLVDFDLHPQQKLIATADRDEKIRVSFYPNCFEIYTFLLGHSKFVSQVKFSADGKRLLSAGADGYIIVWDLKSKCQLCKHKYVSDECSSIPIVTRLFVYQNKVFLFFNNESFMQILTLTETENDLQISSRIEPLAIVLSDVAMTRGDGVNFHLIRATDEIRLSSLSFDFDCDTLKSVNCWLRDIDLSDRALSTRNKFLETLPRMAVDKTGLQVYYELKEKRLKLNNNKKSNDSEEDDE